VADITYIAIATGFVYLAAILDAWSRRVVGYAISRSIDARITVAALTAAIRTRQPPKGSIHHSDRGSQYVLGDGSLIRAGARSAVGSHPNAPPILFDLFRNGGDFARRFVHESPQLKLDVAIGAGEIRIDRQRPGAQAGWDSSIPRRAVRGCG
jgi:hypothetical protein